MDDAPRILTFHITEQESGLTIRTLLREKLQFSAHQISRLKYQAEGIRIDGHRAYVSHVLAAGETLTIGLTKQVLRRDTEGGRPARTWEKPDPSLSAHPLAVLYEDEDLIIVNKPAGIVVHPSPGHYSDTLANQVAEHLGAIGTELDIRVTGRLDKETSGIVTFGQNTETAAIIQRQRAEGTLVKTYIALAEGDFANDSGVVDAPLRREESQDRMRMMVAEDGSGKAARTFYRVLRRLTGPDGTARTLLACRIEHGRTHQIRVHMAYTGHPLVGDPLYGAMQREYEAAAEAPKRMGPEHEAAAEASEPMGLHAWKLSLDQPFTGERIEVEAALPAWAAPHIGRAEQTSRDIRS